MSLIELISREGRFKTNQRIGQSLDEVIPLERRLTGQGCGAVWTEKRWQEGSLNENFDKRSPK